MKKKYGLNELNLPYQQRKDGLGYDNEAQVLGNREAGLQRKGSEAGRSIG